MPLNSWYLPRAHEKWLTFWRRHFEYVFSDDMNVMCPGIVCIMPSTKLQTTRLDTFSVKFLWLSTISDNLLLNSQSKWPTKSHQTLAALQGLTLQWVMACWPYVPDMLPDMKCQPALSMKPSSASHPSSNLSYEDRRGNIADQTLTEQVHSTHVTWNQGQVNIADDIFIKAFSWTVMRPFLKSVSVGNCKNILRKKMLIGCVKFVLYWTSFRSLLWICCHQEYL